MSDTDRVKGPTVPADTFEVSGHCCGVRLRGTDLLTDEGIVFELTPEARRQLEQQGMQLPLVDEEEQDNA